MTTSVVATSRGHFGDALAANPAGILLMIGAIALLVVRPVKVRLPVAALVVAVTGMWVFQLFRFSVL
jgi:Na+-translocating ferredoxin:NAD+ oxidoreductase RnfD subunit